MIPKWFCVKSDPLQHRMPKEQLQHHLNLVIFKNLRWFCVKSGPPSTQNAKKNNHNIICIWWFSKNLRWFCVKSGPPSTQNVKKQPRHHLHLVIFKKSKMVLCQIPSALDTKCHKYDLHLVIPKKKQTWFCAKSGPLSTQKCQNNGNWLGLRAASSHTHTHVLCQKGPGLDTN